jgi:hypothetical protein
MHLKITAAEAEAAAAAAQQQHARRTFHIQTRIIFLS